MRVSIWDMDFFYKKSFVPNPKIMKISSFHKQSGDLINFITDNSHIKMTYDLFYVVREKKTTPKPPGWLIDDKRARLVGPTFKYETNAWDIDAVIAACRPDYMLYPEKEERDPYYNANIVQFYHNGQLLSLIQPFENTLKYHKKTLVIDKEFWDVSDENVIYCLQELTKYKNISFLAPIRLKKIINNKQIMFLFLKLDFSPGTIFKFQNNIGSTYEDALLIFDFIEKLKEKNPDVRLGNVPIKCITLNHWESKEAAIEDLERCLKIFAEAKHRKIHILLVSPDRRDFETPYWFYFEILEGWSREFEELSYIELMLHSSVERYQIPWNGILNNSIYWALPNCNYLLAVMTNKKEWIEKYCAVQWGDKKLEIELINWVEVDKFKGGNIIG